MIQNDKQLKITKKWRDDFQNAMNKTLETLADNPIKKQFYLDSQQDMLDQFDAEINDYKTNGSTVWCKDND